MRWTPLVDAEGACDGVEGAAQIRSDRGHNRNGSDCDQRGDEAVFDGGRAVFALRKLAKKANIEVTSQEQKRFFMLASEA